MHILHSHCHLVHYMQEFGLRDRLHKQFGYLAVSAVLSEDIVVVVILEVFDELADIIVI